ncbi:MAG: hypothetical protein JO316_01215 [Abitibacteriaceae bacterium]|nr:hypothetical protein [Abditibacteriaceae bacterium]
MRLGGEHPQAGGAQKVMVAQGMLQVHHASVRANWSPGCASNQSSRQRPSRRSSMVWPTWTTQNPLGQRT